VSEAAVICFGTPCAQITQTLSDEQTPEEGHDAVEPVTYDGMVAALSERTDENIAAQEVGFNAFMTSVQSSVGESALHDSLIDLQNQLVEELLLGKVRAVEAWADGTNEFKLMPKSWRSVVDKLYRINIEDNPSDSLPPFIPTVLDQAQRKAPSRQVWITATNSYEVIDDLIRTKFVVPFADGVVDVGNRVNAALETCGTPRFRRFHAKDSGYHAQHYYGLLPVEVADEERPRMVALEIKILTKMQDLLGELTHLLYEKQRTGEIAAVKKRKLAWQLGDPVFRATYVGHAGHHLESAICELKDAIVKIEEA
jgi:ppGpp synthetase/RelA/SpoT-type nucleotidyltranferase